MDRIQASRFRGFKSRRAQVFSILSLVLIFVAPWCDAQESQPQFRVTNYTIDATLFPSTHMLAAKARIELLPQADLTSLSFRLDSALRVKSVVGPTGQPAQFEQQGLILTLSLPSPLSQGKPAALTVEYSGALASADGSPVEGLKLAYVGPEGSYLLYPACWFPVNGAGLDRFSASMHITVPQGEPVKGMAPMARPSDISSRLWVWIAPGMPMPNASGPFSAAAATNTAARPTSEWKAAT